MGKKIRDVAVGYSLVAKFGAMLVCPILGCLFSGIYLDKQLGTTPWLMFVLMIVGFAYAMYAIYRVATRMHEPSQPKEENNI